MGRLVGATSQCPLDSTYRAVLAKTSFGGDSRNFKNTGIASGLSNAGVRTMCKSEFVRTYTPMAKLFPNVVWKIVTVLSSVVPRNGALPSTGRTRFWNGRKNCSDAEYRVALRI